MNKKIILVCTILLIFSSLAYATSHTELDKKINSGTDLSLNDYNSLSAPQKEVYLNKKVANSKELTKYETGDFIGLYDPNKKGHKEAFRKIASKEGFLIIDKKHPENRKATNKHLTSLEDFKNDQDKSILVKAASQDIDIINKNKAIFINYLKTGFDRPLRLEFHPKSKGFQSYDEKTGNFVPVGEESTPFSVALLQSWKEQYRMYAFEVDGKGRLIIKNLFDEGIEIALSRASFAIDPEGGNPIITGGSIKTKNIDFPIEIPEGAKARLEKFGVIFTTKDIPIVIPKSDKLTLLTGKAALDKDRVFFHPDSRFKNSHEVSFKVSKITEYRDGPISYSNSIGGNVKQEVQVNFLESAQVTEFDTIVSDLTTRTLGIFAKEGNIDVELHLDAAGNPKHPYKVVSTELAKGSITILEGGARTILKPGKKPILKGSLPKTPVFTQKGYFISEKGVGVCAEVCYNLLNSLNPQAAVQGEKLPALSKEEIKEKLLSGNKEDLDLALKVLLAQEKVEDPEIVAKLMEIFSTDLYDNKEIYYRKDVRRILIKNQDTLVPKLIDKIKVTEDESILTQIDTLWLMAIPRAGGGNEKAQEFFEELVSSDNKLKRYAAASALTRSVDMLKKRSKVDYSDVLKEMILDSKLPERRYSVFSLSAALVRNFDPQKSIDLIEFGINQQDEIVRERAIGVIKAGGLKFARKNEVEGFALRNFDTKIPEVQKFIFYHVNFNENFPQRQDYFQSVFTDRNQDLELRVEAFGNLRTAEIALLREFSLDPNPEIRTQIMDRLAYSGKSEEGRSLLKEGLKDDVFNVKIKAATGLLGLYNDESGLGVIKEMATLKDLEAIQTLARVDRPEARELLLEIYEMEGSIIYASDIASRIISGTKVIDYDEKGTVKGYKSVNNDLLVALLENLRNLGDGERALSELIKRNDPRYLDHVSLLINPQGGRGFGEKEIDLMLERDDETSKRAINQILLSNNGMLKENIFSEKAKTPKGRKFIIDSGVLGDVNPAVFESKVNTLGVNHIKSTDLKFLADLRHEEVKLRPEVLADVEQRLSQNEHTDRTDSNGWYKEDLASHEDTISTTALLKIQKIMQGLENPEQRTRIGELMERDMNNPATEYGGFVSLDQQGKGNFEFLSPQAQGKDGGYRFNNAFIELGTSTVANFHFHALHEDDSPHAGPSGLPDRPGGDLGAAKHLNTDGVVITAIGKGRFNVDFYTPTGEVIDLGNYEYKTPSK